MTAQRWASRLAELDHEVTIVAVGSTPPHLDEVAIVALDGADVLIALHARRSAPAASWWRTHRTTAPLAVALAGTDLYIDMPEDAAAMRTVTDADHLIVLQRQAIERLTSLIPGTDRRVTVVHQSVDLELPDRAPAAGELRVVVLAHLRDVKDPLMVARAARLLPDDSSVTVHHAGSAHDERWREAALEERRNNPRYHWYGGIDRQAAMLLLASGHALACTSLFEGGANVVTEAIAMGVPVIGTRMDGNTGLLGQDHPGLVPVGDDAAMASLLRELERSPHLLDELETRSRALSFMTTPDAERESLRQVLSALT